MVVVASYKCDVLSIRVLSNAYSTHTHTHTWNVTSSQQTQERQQCRSLFWLLFVALSNQIQNVCCVHCLILIVLNYVFIYFWWYWLLLCRHVFGMLKRLNREYCAAKQNCGVLWFFSGEWTTDFWDLPDFFRLYETLRSFCRTSRDLQRLFTPEETFWDLLGLFLSRRRDRRRKRRLRLEKCPTNSLKSEKSLKIPRSPSKIPKISSSPPKNRCIYTLPSVG